MKRIMKQRLIRNKRLTVVGTVTPISWDNKGHAVRYSIFTNEQEDLIIENSTLNYKLNSLLNKVVEATGKLYSNKDGEKCMRLEKVKVLRGPSSPAPAIVSMSGDSGWLDEFSINIPNEVALFNDNGYFDQYWEAC